MFNPMLFGSALSLSVLLTQLLLPQPAANAADQRSWTYPSSEKHVSRPFEPPAQNWLAGHRGIDFPAKVGDRVMASGSGTVIYAGPLANKGVVVINHGLIRTTYEPVAPSVSVGDLVSVGQVIGTVQPGISHCATEATAWCLHWGAIRNGKYLNPLLLVNPRVRLLPLK